MISSLFRLNLKICFYSFLFFVPIVIFAKIEEINSVAFSINSEPVTITEVRAYLLLESGNCNIIDLKKAELENAINYEKVFYIITKYRKFTFKKMRFKIASYMLEDYYFLNNEKLKYCKIDKKILDSVLLKYLTVTNFFNIMYSEGYTKKTLNDFLSKSFVSLEINQVDF